MTSSMQLCLCDGWSNEGGDRTKCPAHGHLYVMLEALERRADDLLVCLKDAEKDLETEHRVREHFGKMIEEIMDAFGKPCKVEQADLPRHVHRLLRACRSLYKRWRTANNQAIWRREQIEKVRKELDERDALRDERDALQEDHKRIAGERAAHATIRAEVERLQYNYDQQDAYCNSLLDRIKTLEAFIELIALGADREALSQCDCQSERDGVWVRWALKQSDEAAKLLDRNDSCEDDDYDPGDPLLEVEKEKS